MLLNFNADVGEEIGNEVELLPYLQWCNIACGAHAGNNEEIERIIQLAAEQGVKIGAHPSFDDRENFGRKVHSLSEKALIELVSKQVELVYTIALKHQQQLTHVKPHGALYHEACNKPQVAIAIIKAIQSISPHLAVVGLPNSSLELCAKELNCVFLKEGFADRRYNNDGSLVARTHNNALITQKEEVLAQVQSMFNNHSVKTIEGTLIPLEIDTICFHGDTKGAAELLRYCYDSINY